MFCEAISFVFSPCSGIVISGYSKTLTDKSLLAHLTKAIIPYKKFKKMYKVDTTGEFRGKQELLSKSIFLPNTYYPTIQNMTLLN